MPVRTFTFGQSVVPSSLNCSILVKIVSSLNKLGDRSEYPPQTVAASALIYATISYPPQAVLRQDVYIPLSLQEVRRQNTIHIRAADRVRCKFTSVLQIATINARREVPNRLNPYRRGIAHLIVPLAHLYIGPLALIRFVHPPIVLNICDKNRFLFSVQNHHKHDKVDGMW